MVQKKRVLIVRPKIVELIRKKPGPGKRSYYLKYNIKISISSSQTCRILDTGTLSYLVNRDMTNQRNMENEILFENTVGLILNIAAKHHKIGIDIFSTRYIKSIEDTIDQLILDMDMKEDDIYEDYEDY